MKFHQRLFPHFFAKEPIPPITNRDLQQAITRVKQAVSLMAAIQMALDIMADKYCSRHFMTYLLLYRLFEKDPNKLWQRSGFLHCTQQNYLLRVLLIKSGWLTENQIHLNYSLVWYISPHQFLRLILPTRPVAVDPWNYDQGVPLGCYAVGFGSRKLKS